MVTDPHGIISPRLDPETVREPGQNEGHRKDQSGAEDRNDEAAPSPLHIAQGREQHGPDATAGPRRSTRPCGPPSVVCCGAAACAHRCPVSGVLGADRARRTGQMKMESGKVMAFFRKGVANPGVFPVPPELGVRLLGGFSLTALSQNV